MIVAAGGGYALPVGDPRAGAYLAKPRYEQFGGKRIKIPAAWSAATLRATSTAPVA